MMLKVLCPGIALLGQGQRANALASQREERIANGGQHGRQSRFAQSRWGIIGLEEMNLDFRWSLRQAHWRILVEVALYGAAALDGDLVAHQVTQPLDDTALDFIEGAAGIDDLAAYVAGHPNFVDANLVAWREMNFGDFREMSAMAEMEGHAHGRIFRQFARTPAGSVGDELQHSTHALGVEQRRRRSAGRSAFRRGKCTRGVAEHG